MITKQIFIIGTWMSGVSLASQLLALKPSLYRTYNGDCSFLSDQNQFLDCIALSRRINLLNLIRPSTAHIIRRILRGQSHVYASTNYLRILRGALLPPSEYRALLSKALTHSSKTNVYNNPAYPIPGFGQTQLLASIFPNAKFILLRRCFFDQLATVINYYIDRRPNYSNPRHMGGYVYHNQLRGILESILTFNKGIIELNADPRICSYSCQFESLLQEPNVLAEFCKQWDLCYQQAHLLCSRSKSKIGSGVITLQTLLSPDDFLLVQNFYQDNVQYLS